MSPIQTIFGFWLKPTSSVTREHDLDIEAQTVQGTQTPLPLTPSPMITSPQPAHSPRFSAEDTDPIDDFFGVTHDSRHDLRLTPTSVSSSSSSVSDMPPPPYNPQQRRYSSELPAYTTEPQSEPITLAQYLFKFGFIFPFFWLFGALILLSPLTAPADFHPSKPEAERQELVLLMRRAEVRWARRCLWAISGLLVAVALVVGCVVGILKGKVGM